MEIFRKAKRGISGRDFHIGAEMIPRPKKIDQVSSSFQINPDTRIFYSNPLNGVAKYLQSNLRAATGYPLPKEKVGESGNLSNTIQLQLPADGSSGPEGYSIQIDSHSINISGTDPAGVFYGFQTLRQMLPLAIESSNSVPGVDWMVPGVLIEDQPSFPWRGLHLDVSRHIYPVDFLKKMIDLMVLYKLNTFHLHLTDDQGWRIEIKRYPRLTEIGAQRESTPLPHDRSKSDGTPYGGFYTQEEIRDLVSYAEERFITIIPEIEMPGHALAALAAYPEYGCKGADYQVGEVWGMQEDVFCPGNPDFYPFLEGILEEVMALFPSEYIHIGGDECVKVNWETCPKCQKVIKEEGLQDENELQSHFLSRIGGFLEKNQRKMLGWDEILQGGLPEGAVVMSWRGAEGGIQAASEGHEVVMSPNTHCYFDHYQSRNTADEPPAIGGYLPLEKVYEFNPLDGVPAEFHKYILGGQGNIWTEYLPTAELVEYMAFPRALALADVLWQGERVDYPEFLSRIKNEQIRLEHLGVNFRPLDDID